MLSVVVLTKNEEKKISACLKSVSFADEIIVVDDYSTDKTRIIARKYTPYIYQKSLNRNFARQRNFGLKKAKGDWVFFIDADEVIPKSLKHEIIKTLALPAGRLKQDRSLNFNGYFVNREDFFLGKRLHYGETASIRLVRLARKEKGKWQRPVHETWQVKGEVGKLNSPLLHYSHDSLSSMLLTIDNYSTINAEYLMLIKCPVRVYDLVFYPWGKFLQNFIVKRGFLDGVHGLIFAVMMSLHSFLTRAKLYILTKNAQK